MYFLQLKTVDHDSGTESDDEHSPEREPKITKRGLPETTQCKLYSFSITLVNTKSKNLSRKNYLNTYY